MDFQTAFKASLFSTSLLLAGVTHAVTSAELLAQGQKPMDDAAILATTQGNTLDHKMAGTRLVAPIFYREGGMRTVNAKAFGGAVSSSKWWVENGRRCEISARTKGTQCGQIFKQESNYIVCFDDEEVCKWTFAVRPGNPDGLPE